MSESILKSNFSNFTLYPLVWLTICFVSGIITANFLTFGWQIYLTICLIFVILAAVFIKRKFVLIFIFAGFAAAGALYFQIENQSILQNRVKILYDEHRIESGDPIELEGVLQSGVESVVGGFFLRLKTEKAIYKNEDLSVSGIVRLFAAAPTAQTAHEYARLDLQYGTRIRVACNLRREDNFQNAGVVSHIKLLDQQEIDATANIKSPLLVEKIEDAPVFSPLAFIYQSRQNLINQFREKFSVSTAGVLIASLLGNKCFLDKPTAEVFRDGGTFHVLVISGLHITFIGGLTLLFVQFFTNKRLWQFLFACSFLWTFSLAVGAEVPVVRATIMFTILLFSQVIYRSGTLLNALGFCALILLVWRPNDVFTSSFQLTFASVGAIVTIAFPLIEKLRSIGNWSPSIETPFPPKTPVWLKRFCETLYWREKNWERKIPRQLWSANLFKAPHLKWLEARNLQTVSQYIFEAFAVSLIMQICLLPLMTVYFHRFPVLSVFLNLWVGIVIALESFAAVFAVILASISDALALPIIKLTELLNWLLISVPSFFTESSLTNLRLPTYSGAMKSVYIFYFAPIIVLAVALNLWNPFSLSSKFQNSKFNFFSASPLLHVSASLLLVLSASIIFHPFSAPKPDGRLRIDFLDVGQGDSALITFPNGETLLVDGGGRRNFNPVYLKKEDEDEAELFEPDVPNIGEAVVSQFLLEKGYSQIDYILATHADADHIQGLSDVAKNFRVRAAFFGRMPFKDAEFAKLFDVLQQRGIDIVTLSRGDVLTFDKVKVEVLSPKRNPTSDAVSDNNNSVVTRIIYGERKFLLTGDVEKEAEKELINAPEFLQADVIKVAHHGSRTSSTVEFVSASKAKLAIIPVGRESFYGHPHTEIVERWKSAGAKVLTTGENGTVSVSTDGRDLQLKTFLKEKIYR